MPRPAASHIAAALAATALTLAGCPPSEAAASTAWQVAFRGHFGSAGMGNDLLAVAASSTASAWAVGGTQTSGDPSVSPVVLHWDGTAWSVAKKWAASQSGQITGITAGGLEKTAGADAVIWGHGPGT